MKEKTNYNDLSVEDLNNRRRETSEELLQARRKLRMGQFKKTSEFTRLRKEVARIKTNLRLRELAQDSKKLKKKSA